MLWRAWSTGPDSDVLIGEEYRPFYEAEKGTDLGVTTWPADAWRQGGGTVWGWLSYDPDLDLVYYGTANPSPWNHAVRPGDNKWAAGLFARDPDTGQARWFYHTNPHDLWDHDAVNESVLLDLPWNGADRRVLVRPQRNGYMYVIDRAPGEVLAADPFVPVNSSTGVDLETGRLQVVAEKEPKMGRVVRDVCPSAPGAKDWNPSAFSPQTGWLYVPHNNLCMDWELTEVSYIAGTPYIGTEERYHAAAGGVARGEMMAGDLIGRRKAWTIPSTSPCGAAPWRPRAGSSSKARWGLVQGGRRRHGRAPVAVQDRQRDHRPADHLPGTRRAPVRGDPLRHRGLARLDRLRRPRPA